MDIVTLDFETYYDKDYTLSKMTTEAYIRDPRFEIIGVGVKINDYPTDWYSGDNPGKFLKALDYSTKAILCHNTAFDGAILSWHFGIRPRLWLDTLSMARPFHGITVGGSLAKLAAHYELGKKGDEVVAAMGKRRADFTEAELARYGQYCVNDVELTKQLFDKLKVGFPVTELLVIDQTIRMYTEPTIELDTPLLEKHLEEVRARKRTLMAELAQSMGGEEVVQEVLMSNEKFANYLKSLGVKPPTKISPRTGKETWAFAKTDKGMADLLEHPDERVQTAVAARLGVKSTLEETRTEALLEVAKRGRLPIMLNYYGAHTGRFSGGDKLNLQNLPSRGNTTIKRALKALPGNVLIAADSSQIEARLVAYIAGQDDLVEAFREKRDVYSEFATEIYGRKITKADKVERYVGKVCVLGLGYGLGAAKLQRTLEIGQGGISVKIDLNEAERIVRIYRAKNFRIAQFWQKCANALTDMVQGRSGNLHDVLPYDSTGITLPSGFKIQYPALRSTPNGFMYVNDPRAYQKAMSEGRSIDDIEESAWTRIYGGKVTENCIAEGTLVLTTRGWVPIERVEQTDLVHDGVEFVQHGGVVFKSVQSCVMLDGVFLTPDHEVLTDDGWKEASQVQRPYRPDLRDVDGAEPRVLNRQDVEVAVCVPMWATDSEGRGVRNQRSQTWRDSKLWVHDQTAYIQGEYQARNEQTSGLRRLAQYARPVYATVAPSVEKLWWAGYNGVRTLAEVLQQLLGGYGWLLPEGARLGPYRQQRPVFPGELPVGEQAYQHYEQTQFCTNSRCTIVERPDGYKPQYIVLSNQARLALGRFDQTAITEKPVYDILNCGPRHRFVVKGATGPMIVHNCVQALAALVIREQMAAIGRHYHVVFQVHDEIIITASEADAEKAEAKLVEVMSTPPKWAPGLPVACEAGAANNYGDA